MKVHLSDPTRCHNCRNCISLILYFIYKCTSCHWLLVTWLVSFLRSYEMLQLSQLYLNISLFPKCASSPWLLNIWFSNQTWTTTSAVSDGSTKSAQHLLQVFKVYLTQIWKSFTMTMMMFRTWKNLQFCIIIIFTIIIIIIFIIIIIIIFMIIIIICTMVIIYSRPLLTPPYTLFAFCVGFKCKSG